MDDIKAFIWRGALAGLLGGIAAALFQWAVTEEQIRVALEIEAANSSGGGEELFSRGEQVFGGMVAAGLYGLCIGVVFGIACAALWHTLPGRSAFGRASRLAAVAFVAWALVPALKYPANPPAVGDPDTAGERTVAYLGLMAVSMLVAYLAWELWQRLTARGVDGAERFAAVAGAYLAAVTVTYLVFPANPDANEAPANLIWHFRLDSIGGNALLWLVLGTTFGWLGDRSVRHRAADTTPERVAAEV